MGKSDHARLISALIQIHELRTSIYKKALGSLEPERVGLLHLFRCMISESQYDITELRQLAQGEGYTITTTGRPLAKLVHIVPERSLSILLKHQQLSLAEFEETVVLRAYELAIGKRTEVRLSRVLSAHHAELKISSNLIKGCMKPQMLVG